MAKNASSYVDRDLEIYVQGLKNKDSTDLEEELAHLYFDYLFVQTQMEASKFDERDNLQVQQSGKRRLLRLHAKIEALKTEIFGRLKTEISE